MSEEPVMEDVEEVALGESVGGEEEDIGFIVLSPDLLESMLQYIDVLEKYARGEISVTEAKGFVSLIKPPEVKKKKAKKTKTTSKKKAAKKSSKTKKKRESKKKK